MAIKAPKITIPDGLVSGAAGIATSGSQAATGTSTANGAGGGDWLGDQLDLIDTKMPKPGKARALTALNSKGQLIFTKTNQLVPKTSPIYKKWQASKSKTAKKTAPKTAAGRRAAAAAGASAPVVDTTEEDVISASGMLGSPDKKNISSIVDSIIADATKQYSWANDDALRKAGGDLNSIAGGALAVDQVNQAGMAYNEGMGQKLAQMNTKAQADSMANAAAAQASAVASNGVGGATAAPESAALYAQSAGDLAATQSADSQTTQANNAFFNMSRAANAQSAQEAGRGVRGALSGVMAQNNRNIAAVRAQRAAIAAEQEKAAWDTHIAKKMAESELAQRGSSLQNDAVNRAATRTATAGNQNAAALEREKLKAAQYEIANGILWGTGQKMKVPVGTDDSGKTMYEEQYAPVGQASTVAEAVNRLSLAGLTGKAWRLYAQKAFNEQASQRKSSQTSFISGVASNPFGYFFPGTSSE